MNVDAGSGEDAGELGVERGGSAGDGQGFATERLLPLAKNQLAGQLELGVVKRAQALVLVSFGQSDGPEKESALDAG